MVTYFIFRSCAGVAMTRAEPETQISALEPGQAHSSDLSSADVAVVILCIPRGRAGARDVVYLTFGTFCFEL